jgi:hypothetical protein
MKCYFTCKSFWLSMRDRFMVEWLLENKGLMNNKGCKVNIPYSLWSFQKSTCYLILFGLLVTVTA